MNFTEADLKKMLENPHVKEHGKSPLIQALETLENLPSAPLPKAKGKTRGRQPNKTETRAYDYLKVCYPDSDIRYEAITFHLLAGAAYTPDYLITSPLHSNMICVEIKNAAYKHASYGRSRLAYRQAALEFPQYQFIWLELQKGEWVLN